jgi:hypothetical protein
MFSFAEALIVSQNSLVGSIPDTIGLLTKLGASVSPLRNQFETYVELLTVYLLRPFRGIEC